MWGEGGTKKEEKVSLIFCLMTSDDIQCHVWPNLFLSLQVARSDIRPHTFSGLSAWWLQITFRKKEKKIHFSSYLPLLISHDINPNYNTVKSCLKGLKTFALKRYTMGTYLCKVHLCGMFEIHYAQKIHTHYFQLSSCYQKEHKNYSYVSINLQVYICQKQHNLSVSIYKYIYAKNNTI